MLDILIELKLQFNFTLKEGILWLCDEIDE